MIAAVQIPALPERSGRMVGDSSTRNDPANWTCYNAGESISEWVMQAAENSSTAVDILSMLAESCNVDVRMAVADNGNALLETTMMLAQDESVDLRYQLAESHNIDESVLKLLVEDPNPYVAHRAKKTLARLAGGATNVVYAAPKVVPIVSIKRFASTHAMGSKLKD